MMNNDSLLYGVSDEKKRLFMQKVFPRLHKDYDALYQHLSGQRWAEAGKLIHKIKGIVSMLGIDDLFEDLLHIDAQCLVGQLSPDALQDFKIRSSTCLNEWTLSLTK